MYKSQIKRSATIDIVCMLGGLIALLITASTWAGVECHEWAESLETSSPNGFGPFTGPSEVTIDGVPHSAEFIAVPSSSLKFLDDGRIKGRFSDLWTFEDGNALIARSKVEVTPTGNPGEFFFTVKERFNGGAGLYEKAFGRARLEGIFQIQQDGSAVTMTTATGKLCLRSH